MPSDDSILDWSEALKSVQGDVELLRRVVQAVLQECPAHLHQMRDAIVASDSKTAVRLAHTIRGSMRMLAATTAESIAAELESSTRSGVDSSQLQMHEQLVAALEPVFAVLSDFVAGIAGPN